MVRIGAPAFGSSPHTRGTHDDETETYSYARFIPAYAGNAPRMPRRPTRSPVHPRIRGERGHSFTGALPPPGSSPHTRGTPGVGRRVRRDGRFIPAYAGNARPRPCASCAATVHPRIRGERLVGPIAEPPCLGSSPHTRGTPGAPGAGKTAARFIPAYAGNAARAASRRPPRPVHPRIRGERYFWHARMSG